MPAGFYWKFYGSLFMVYVKLCTVNLFMIFGNGVLWIAGRSLLRRVAGILWILIRRLPVTDLSIHSYLFGTSICCSTTGFMQYFKLHTYTSL